MSDKKQRIGKLIYRIENGNDIQNRDLKSVLTDEEFERYEEIWKDHLDWKSGRNYQFSSQYEELLKKGDFATNKADSGRFNKETTAKLYRQAESYYESALEALEEESKQNPMIGASYDRSYNTLTSSNTDLSYHGMPRRLTSKSLQNQGNVVYSAGGGSTTVKQQLTKRDFKLKALKESYADFDNRGKQNEIDESAKQRLKELMKKFKK